MKKLLVLLLTCVLLVQGCQKKETVTGTPMELNNQIVEMIDNDDFTNLKNFEYTDQLKTLGESGRVGSILDPTLDTLGDFLSSEESYEETVAQYLVINTPCHFELGDINLEVYFLDGKIANIMFGYYATSPEK